MQGVLVPGQVVQYHEKNAQQWVTETTVRLYRPDRQRVDGKQREIPAGP